jgi:signal transduction histidine kinase
MPSRISAPPRLPSRIEAELLAAGWEAFSALLFATAVVPAARTMWAPAAIFFGSLALSALVAQSLARRGTLGRIASASLRIAAWPSALAPLVPTVGWRALVAAVAFGLMAGGIRRAIDRRIQEGPSARLAPEVIAASLRNRLAERAMVVGIVGGHVLLLFSVAFLRTQSQVLFKLWFQVVPLLGLLGTIGYTLAVHPLTGRVVAALEAGQGGDPPLLRRGLAQAVGLPDALAWLNFGVWFSFTAAGALVARPGPLPWTTADAVMQVALGALFACGVSFYQRGLHQDTVAPVVARLRAWTGEGPAAEPIPLRRRMQRAFGLPLVFTTALSLLSSIGLYRALSVGLSFGEDVNAIGALFASFAMLVLAVGGVVAREARELSRPMATLAQAADRVASGELSAAVPRIEGPIEVEVLGESVERMRVRLAGMIAELSREREGLEAKVEARTAELSNALSELKRTQAALVQGERLASIGELCAGVAHEIYNPLNAIAGAAAPLGRLSEELGQVIGAFRAVMPELGAERQQALEAICKDVDVDAALEDLVGIAEVIRRACDRSVKIVANLKSFSRTRVEAIPADLRAGLEETLVLLDWRLRQAGIEVERRYEEMPEVTCRVGEMNQVFMNLLVNAIQALEGEGGAAPKRIVVEARASGGFAEVAVGDNGAGVPAEIGKRIFDPFFTTKPRGQGTGLGLSISSDIARRHGGTLALEASEGGGARFVCRIPMDGPDGPTSLTRIPR